MSSIEGESLGRAVLELSTDSSKYNEGIDSAQGRADGLGSKFGTLTKAAGLLAGGAALGAVAFTLKTGIDEWKQSTLVATQTEAVLKSTGGAAGVTAKQVSDLAGAMLKKTGIDDEAIQSGENLLLTFTGIRNEVGKGNDIFNQSTKIMADMSVSLGQDMKSSAIQLGKALNDPIKGVTALQRVGVSFTQSQKDSIKAMVDSGNTMGAQKLILGELNKEFGGSAEAAGKTLPGQLNVLKESFNNMAGNIVGSLMPSLTGVTSWVNSTALPAMQDLGGKIGTYLGPIMHAFGSFLSDTLMPILSTLWGVFQNNILPIVERLGEVFKTAVTKIGGVVQDNMPQIKAIFENVGKIMRDIGDVVIPILKVAFGTVLPAALRIVIPVLGFVSGAIADVVGVLKNVLTWGGKVASWLIDLPGKIKGLFVGLGSALAGILSAPINAIIDAIDAIKFPVGMKIKTWHGIPDGIDVQWGSLNIPHLDTGGTIAESGIAMVHKGESVIPADHRAGGGLTIHTGPIYGAITPQIAQQWVGELATALDGRRIPAVTI